MYTANLSSTSCRSAGTISLGLSLAVSSAAQLQAAEITIRDARPLSPVNTQFRGHRFTAVRPDSPLNGTFSIMQARWTPEYSNGLARFSADVNVIYGGTSVPSASSFRSGVIGADPLLMTVNIWSKALFNPLDLNSGWVSTEVVGRTGPAPIRSGTSSSGRPVYSITYDFRLPEISSSSDYLIGFARQSRDLGLQSFEFQHALSRPNLMIESSPDHVLASYSSPGPTGNYLPEPGGQAGTEKAISSHIVVTTVPETTSSILALAAFAGLCARSRRP